MYSQKAFDILDASINNAVFIDEKAKDFFSGTELNPNIAEEKLSFDLFDTFKKNGKNLTVHKFVNANIQEPKTIEYLFKGKDLILLDWELDDLLGQEHSLNLLHKAVSSPNINFCCIYSSSNNFNNIPLFLDTYFSGLTESDFETIRNTYSNFNPNDLQNEINKNEDAILVFADDNGIDFDDFPIKELRGKAVNYLFRLIHISLNINLYHILEGDLPKYEVFNNGNDSFMINNTFVLTLKKDFTEDSDYVKLIKRISDIVITNKGSFFQLLGLEMQSIFNSNEKFIDETILKSSTEALFQFRNHLKDDKTFGIIIKKLLIEQATLKLRTAKLKLLDSDFLTDKSEKIKEIVSNEDLFQLNVFYNSVTVERLNIEDIPNLNFGDVFKGQNKDYYLCITALCDCYYPTEGNFYFAKGTEFNDIELALKLGDTAFLSFLPDGKAVYWGDVETPSLKKSGEIELSNSSDEVKKLKDDICKQKALINRLQKNQEILNRFLYKPFFIKPKVYNVKNNKLVDKKIQIWDITNNLKVEPSDQNLNYFDVEYITTLRNDYAQRIANHAFGHPARVGVDFVKIK